MSVRVTYLRTNSTENARADFGGHSHSISATDYDVASADELETLSSRVGDHGKDIARLENKSNEADRNIRSICKSVSELAGGLRNLDARVEATFKALNETGQLATAFKSVTDKHLGNIQKVVDSLSVKIKDGERELKAKANDGLEQIKRTASDVAAKIHEAEQTVSAGVKKSSEAVTEFGKIREQAVTALKNTAAIVQKQLSEFVAEKTAKIDAVEQSVQKSAISIKESVGKIAALQAAADKLEERLQLIEREDTLGKLAAIEQKYHEALEACQDTLSAANYFRSVNRSFFSRLWWCLTGNCKEEVKEEVSDDQADSTETEDNS